MPRGAKTPKGNKIPKAHTVPPWSKTTPLTKTAVADARKELAGRLIIESEFALVTLASVMTQTKNQMARVQAAKVWLDHAIGTADKAKDADAPAVKVNDPEGYVIESVLRFGLLTMLDSVGPVVRKRAAETRDKLLKADPNSPQVHPTVRTVPIFVENTAPPAE